MTYSSSIAIGRQRFAAKQQNTTRFNAKERTLGPVSNTIILIVLACLLGLLYLTQVTKTNALSYQISDLKQHQTELTDQHSELEVSAARLQSLDRVKNSNVANKLVSLSPSTTIQN